MRSSPSPRSTAPPPTPPGVESEQIAPSGVVRQPVPAVSGAPASRTTMPAGLESMVTSLTSPGAAPKPSW
jgi:hypothetical protein